MNATKNRRKRNLKRHGRAASLTLAAIAIVPALAGHAAGAQTQASTPLPPPPPLLGMPRSQAAGLAASATQVSLGGPYTYWNWPSGKAYSSFTVPVTIASTTTPDAPFFWSYQFTTPREQGYVGLQSHSSFNGSKIALFSLWAGDAATGPNCGPFEEFGTGYSCRLDPFNWVTGRQYRVRVNLGTKDASGQWYRGSVTDTVTKITRTIGRIHVPAGGTGSFRGWVTWTEFFGNRPSTCAAMPKARADFGYPYANGGAVRVTSHVNDVAPGDCRASIQDLAGAVRHRYPA